MAMHAWHIMREKISIKPDATAQDAALKLIAAGLAAIPVVSDAQEVQGIVSETAILGAMKECRDLETIPVPELMVAAPITADVNTSPDDLIKLLIAHCCSVVTIVNNGKYAGVVSRHMLMDIYTSPSYARFSQKDRKGPFVCK